MRRVVVTGAGGRLGGAIAQRLREDGRLVAGVDRCPGELVSDVVDLTRKSERLRALLADADAVIHAAALPGPAVEPPPRSADSNIGHRLMRQGVIGLESELPEDLLIANVTSTARVFEEACRSSTVRRVIFSSSAFAMGWSHDSSNFIPIRLPLTEKDGPLPFETYGLSKQVGEAMAQCYARSTGVEFVSLRFTNVVKRDKYPHTLPWAYDEQIPFVMWAWCHEDDVIDAHIRAIDCSPYLTNNFATFLIAAPSTRFSESTLDLAQRHFRTQFPPTVEVDGNSSIFDCSRATEALDGWNPRCWTRGSAAARAALRDPELQTFLLDRCQMVDSGEKFPPGACLAYKVHRCVHNDVEAPVILHPTSYGAVHTDLEYNIGPGKTLDTNRYHVVVCNMFGNGVSCSPSTAGSAGYPKTVSIADNVRLQRLALLDAGLLESPLIIYGYSMGAMQAWEWAKSFPKDVAAVIAVCGSTGCTDYNSVFLKALQRVLEIPHAERSEKLRLFATIYAGWGVGYAAYRDRLCGTVDDFVDSDYVPGFADDDPEDLLAMLRTWRSTESFTCDTLHSIRARCLIMPCDTDTYFRLDHIRAAEAALVDRATLQPIQSPYGHRAGDPWRTCLRNEAEYIKGHVQAFLSQS